MISITFAIEIMFAFVGWFFNFSRITETVMDEFLLNYYPCQLCLSAWLGRSSPSACLFVYLQRNSKKNDPKVFKLGIGIRE